MGRNYNMNTKTVLGGQSVWNLLTEENLRLHSSAHVKNDSPCGVEQDTVWAPYYLFDADLDGSDDGDVDSRNINIAMRRAASLEALKAYGGCFASGFLAMHEPLPRASRRNRHTTRQRYEDVESRDLQRLASEMTSIETRSSTATSVNSHKHVGCPRPDSDTLSQAEIEPLKNERKRKWTSIGKKRRSIEKWLKL